MRLKFISILLAALFIISPGALAMDRNALRAAWREIALVRSDASPYQEVPDPESFSPGSLTVQAQQDALNCLNFLRRIAGLESVSLNPLYSLRAQNGALLLAANDFLDHNAPQPAGMNDELYHSAHLGTSLGNIAKFNWMKPDILIDGVRYFARDDGMQNLPVLGHRRWLLNPLMAQTGFGLANAASGISYVSMYAVDMGNANVQWDHVAWPSPDAFPVELMRAELAWSVSLNDTLYNLSASSPQVWLREEGSGAEFFFEPTSGTGDGFSTISTEPYGSGPCIIFRPEIENKGVDEYLQNQIWSVRITGLTGTDGQPKEISYACRMTSLNPQDPVNVEISQLEADLIPGQPLQLSAEIIPSYADDLSIFWSSSDTSVATVSKSGMVLAVGAGQCLITAESANGRSDSCAVTVE